MNAGNTPDARPWSTAASLVAGAAAAVGASACCAGPLVLVLLGVGGAWGARLVALEPYQPYFIAAALAFFGFAYYRLYMRPANCAPGAACAVPDTRKRQKTVFWVVSVLALALMSTPLYALVLRKSSMKSFAVLLASLAIAASARAAGAHSATLAVSNMDCAAKAKPEALVKATTDAGFPSTVKQAQ